MSAQNNFPCKHCPDGTVIYKNDYIVECQSCFMTTIAPQPVDNTEPPEVEPLLVVPVAVVQAPSGPIPLVDRSFFASVVINGGPCPQCGTFFAWQYVLPVCPHCKLKCRSRLASRAPVYILLVASPMFLIAGIIFVVLLSDNDATGYTLIFNSVMFLVLAGALWAKAIIHDKRPLVDCRPLSPDEIARLVPGDPTCI